jgi:hypothetical protein
VGFEFKMAILAILEPCLQPFSLFLRQNLCGEGCLSLPHAGITGVHHHTQVKLHFLLHLAFPLLNLHPISLRKRFRRSFLSSCYIYTSTYIPIESQLLHCVRSHSITTTREHCSSNPLSIGLLVLEKKYAKILPILTYICPSIFVLVW